MLQKHLSFLVRLHLFTRGLKFSQRMSNPLPFELCPYLSLERLELPIDKASLCLEPNFKLLNSLIKGFPPCTT